MEFSARPDHSALISYSLGETLECVIEALRKELAQELGRAFRCSQCRRCGASVFRDSCVLQEELSLAMPTDSLSKLCTIIDRILQKREISPGKQRVSDFLQAVFFTSLKTEEGRSLQMRIAIVPPKTVGRKTRRDTPPDRWSIVPIGKRIPLTPHTLAKIASAADPWSSSVAVFFDDTGGAFIWGFVDQGVRFSRMLVHETYDASPPPGVIQVQINGTADLSVFRGSTFIARLRLNSLVRSEPDVFASGPVRDGLWPGFERLVDFVADGSGMEGGLRIPSDWELDSTQKAFYSEDAFAQIINTSAHWWFGSLCRLLINISRYRHGGALLITPSSADLKITYPIAYPWLQDALINCALLALHEDTTLFDLLDECENKKARSQFFYDWYRANHELADYESELTGCIRFIASLSCVDGAILASPDLEIRGFGVELLSKTETDVVYLSTSANLHARSLTEVSASNFGTRHRSMFRYCFAHAGSVGFVMSQDGDLRVIRRVGDQLIVWENPKILAWTQRARRAVGVLSESKPRIKGSAQSAGISDDDIEF